MKKIVIILAIVLGLSMTTFADGNGGGLFQRGNAPQQTQQNGFRTGTNPMLPTHNLTGNQNANPEVPVGTGIAVLIGLGVVYAITKKRSGE